MNKKTLVIVESPAKAKTIGKFLGNKYKVIASVGHIRDLPKSTLGIDVEHNFEPKYITIKGKGPVVKELKKEAKSSSNIMLATDPDREGEAISWHLAHILGIDASLKCRIEFHEITKEAITKAAKQPRAINQNLVNAQQARRVLDRLVGYKISPLLWKKIKWGLSAGRVQSAALKIVCDREKLIQAFEPVEYWSIIALLSCGKGKNNTFSGKLIEYNKKKLEIHHEKEAADILKDLKKGSYTVTRVEQKDRNRKPFAPYTTSSLQQDASVKLGFFTKRTMLTAQQLYEGVDIKGEGTVGLITYIRTDSVRISNEAKGMAKDYITNTFGAEYSSDNIYVNKKKDVQDAHEAIRPSYVAKHPDDIKDSLTKDQYQLYKLVWARFVASQMAAAKFDAVSADIANGDYTFRANGSKIKFDGFLKVYHTDEDAEKMLPEFAQGQDLEEKEIQPEQHFTQPPPRFTEASLIKDLEEKDIGRPSTYAPIISTLLDRKYAKREKKTLIPTDLGFIVTDLMENYFKNIVDANFTAAMEDRLDLVESEGANWKDIVEEFYGTLAKELEIAEKEVGKITIEAELTDELCELCGKQMAIKQGRFGEFLACSGYPECKNTKPIMKKTDVNCPVCGKDIIVRKTKKGRNFYGCSGYPDCTFILWNKPINKKCPKCESLLVEKKTKTTELACSNGECDYKE